MSATANRPGVSVTAEQYERLTRLHKELGVTYDAMVNEAIDREVRRRPWLVEQRNERRV